METRYNFRVEDGDIISMVRGRDVLSESNLAMAQNWKPLVSNSSPTGSALVV